MKHIHPVTVAASLKAVDPDQLTGRCHERFKEVYRLTGVPWKEVIYYYASQGYTWADAAALFGLKICTLKGFCLRSAVSFDWQGPAALAVRLRHSQTKKGIVPKGGYTPIRLKAFGLQEPMRELMETFSSDDLSYSCVHSRVGRGWHLEDALTVGLGESNPAR